MIEAGNHANFLTEVAREINVAHSWVFFGVVFNNVEGFVFTSVVYEEKFKVVVFCVVRQVCKACEEFIEDRLFVIGGDEDGDCFH